MNPALEPAPAAVAAIEPIAVPVAGGELSVARFSAPSAAGAPLVLAVHGITANSRSWLGVAEALAGRAELVAVDLRGRGDSRGLPGPYGFAAHEADLLAVLDTLGARGTRDTRDTSNTREAVDTGDTREGHPPVLVGHSLGAYLVAQLAANHPDRVGAVLLVDGGLALDGVDGVDPEEAAAAGLGPALARFALTFASASGYEAWWRRHPAFAGGRVDRALLSAFAAHDLTGTRPELRPSVSEAAVRADMVDLFAAGAATAALSMPATLLVAPRGLLDDPTPLQPLERAQAWAAGRPDRRAARLVPDVNHYSIVMGRSGAAAVADAIAALL